MAKTREEIEHLKENWVRDVCWDIEATEGFEEHVDELKAFSEQKKKEWNERARVSLKNRRKLVREETGIDDLPLAQWLLTFREIELNLKLQERSDSIAARDPFAAAQVRATLLLAAQVKRIADLLENIDGRDGLAESVRIWGSGD